MVDVEAVLLELCRALARIHRGHRYRWASHAELAHELASLTEEQLDLAIAAAGERGWASAGGTPPHSIMLTEAGWRAIEPKRKGRE